MPITADGTTLTACSARSWRTSSRDPPLRIAPSSSSTDESSVQALSSASACVRASAKSRAFWMAAPAWAASMMATASSASVKSPPSRFSVRYRFPKTLPPAITGTPRNVRIGGWFGGKPTERGSDPMSESRSGRASVMSTPRIPLPVGRSPMAARSSSPRPAVMNWASLLPGSSSTPIAPYRAPVRSHANCTRRGRICSSSSPPAIATPASRTAWRRSSGAVALTVGEYGIPAIAIRGRPDADVS